jgi:hypothetical protein
MGWLQRARARSRAKLEARDVRIERDLPLSAVDVVRNREGILARYVTLLVDGKRYRLQFSTPYRSDGAAIAEAAGETEPPPRPNPSVR